MRIVCPNCAATYDVPPALVGSAQRQVRCVRCAAEWRPPEFSAVAEAAVPPPTPMLADPAPEMVATEPVALTAPPRLAAEPRMPGPKIAANLLAADRVAADRVAADRVAADRPVGHPRIAVMLALGFSLVLLAAGGLALWHWRGSVVGAWPASARLFMWLDRLRG